MPLLRSIIPRIPSYSNIKFSTTELGDVHLETVKLSYNLYGNIESLTNISPFIIMHGLFGSKSNWNSMCKALQRKISPQRTILSVDARNHGESPHSINHSYNYLAEDVRTLFKDLNIRKSALLGHSMGGRVMMYFALKYPNLVDKLIVADVSPVSTSSSIYSMQNLISIMENVRFPKNVQHISAARVELNKVLASSIDDPGLRAFLLTNLKQNSDGSFAWRINLEVLKSNFVEIAQFPKMGNAKYDGPVLFIAGGNSDYIRESDYSEILKLFPKAEFKRISGAGHWLHSEKPAEFLQLVLEFLNRRNL